jgi:hypothetical protein
MGDIRPCFFFRHLSILLLDTLAFYRLNIGHSFLSTSLFSVLVPTGNNMLHSFYCILRGTKIRWKNSNVYSRDHFNQKRICCRSLASLIFSSPAVFASVDDSWL